MSTKSHSRRGATAVTAESHLLGLLNVRQTAHATGWSEATIRSKVWKRELPYIKMGRSIRFRVEDIRDLIEQNTIPALEQ